MIWKNVCGRLLDWVGQGIYGLPRSAIGSGNPDILGPYDTAAYNQTGSLVGYISYNAYRTVSPQNTIQMNDDIYRRVLTWHFMKGDGKYFNVKWLKKRIMRFCTIPNGFPQNIDNTDQISITFGPNYEVTIKFIDSITRVVYGSIYNFSSRFTYGSMTPYNTIQTTVIQLTPLPNRQLFKDCVNDGILELPFQFTWDVEI